MSLDNSIEVPRRERGNAGPDVVVSVDSGTVTATSSDGETISEGDDAGAVISDAIDSLRTPFNNGVYFTDLLGHIHLRAGVYEATSPVVVPSGTRGLRLTGAGNSTILRHTVSGGVAVEIGKTGDSYTAQHTVSNLKVTSDPSLDTPAVSGILVDGSRIEIRQVDVVGFGNQGIHLQSGFESYVVGCQVTGCFDGIRVSTNDNELVDNTAHQNRNFGVLLDGNTGGTNVSGGHHWGNDTAGIRIADHDSARLTDVEAEDNNGDGVTVSNSQNVTFHGCDIWQNSNFQMQLFGEHAGALVDGCHFRIGGATADGTPALQEFGDNGSQQLHVDGCTFRGFQTPRALGSSATVGSVVDI